MERWPSNAAMASSRMPRLMAWVASVWRSWWGMDFPDAGLLGGGGDNAVHRAPVDRRVLVGHEVLLGSDVLAVLGRPGGQEDDQVRVQRDEAVVAEFADGDPQPVGVADQGDGV